MRNYRIAYHKPSKTHAIEPLTPEFAAQMKGAPYLAYQGSYPFACAEGARVAAREEVRLMKAKARRG